MRGFVSQCEQALHLLQVPLRAAAPVGMGVSARAELVEVEGRRLVFAVGAHDSAGIVGGVTKNSERRIPVFLALDSWPNADYGEAFVWG